jgi:protein-S-isoprenylcysteine O-methyltransferase Ste14
MFRVVTACLVIGSYTIRLLYRRRFPKRSAPSVPVDGAVWIVILWPASLIFYISVGTMHRLAIPIPIWARWAGVAVFVLDLVLFRWVYATLGRNFSAKLELFDDHELVDAGPYRWVRHPMYATLFLSALSSCLISANLVVVASTTMLITAMTLRIRKEERMMRRRFRGKYLAYELRTGKIFPRMNLFR